MTQRCRLDGFLAERAAEAAADFHDGEPVQAIDLDDRGVGAQQGGRDAYDSALAAPAAAPPVTVRTDAGAYDARILIGADGANGVVRRALGLDNGCEEAVALEGNVPFPGGIPQEWREYVALDLGGTAGGYGWVFPKDDHLNLGVGAWKYAAFTLRPKLAQLSRRYGFDPDGLENLRGHHLPVRRPGTPVARGPVALVGDAAGLVDPLSGEGIHMAFASGRLAAEAALACLAGESPDMSAYQRAVDRRLQPELDVSRRLQELFHFAPPPYVALMRRSEKFWLFFCHLIRGEMTYLDFVRIIGPLRVAMDFFAVLAQRRRLSKVATGTRLLSESRF